MSQQQTNWLKKHIELELKGIESFINMPGNKSYKIRLENTGVRLARILRDLTLWQENNILPDEIPIEEDMNSTSVLQAYKGTIREAIDKVIEAQINIVSRDIYLLLFLADIDLRSDYWSEKSFAEIKDEKIRQTAIEKLRKLDELYNKEWQVFYALAKI